jgi:hypothetical protein
MVLALSRNSRSQEKLGLDVQSAKVEGRGRVYRIAA